MTEEEYQLHIRLTRWAVRKFVRDLGREVRRRYWPEEVWAEEQAEWWALQNRFRAEERIAMSVLPPGNAFSIITGVTP